MSSHEWEQHYLDGRIGWDRGGSSPALKHWTEMGLLTPSARILIPGCGRGHEVIDLARMGLSVTAVDVASSPIEFLNSQLDKEGLEASCIQADLLAWEPDDTFDLIYDQTCLCALDPNHWKRYEGLLRGWLVADGVLLAHFMQTGRAGGPPYHCSLSEMSHLFDSSAWRWSQTELTIGHPAGFKEQLVALTRL
jgi:cyclopropane fatty-acyl-phospholipid synthase-like methyltransferase